MRGWRLRSIRVTATLLKPEPPPPSLAHTRATDAECGPMRGTLSLCGRPPRSVNCATVDPVASCYPGCSQVVQVPDRLMGGEPPFAGIPCQRGTGGGWIHPEQGPGGHIDL